MYNSESEKLVLFGAGLTGRGAKEYFHDQVVAVIDNDIKKQGQSFEELPIISLADYKRKYRSHTIVISVFSKRYFEVIEQLEREGITNYFTIPAVVYGYPSPENYINRIIGRKKKEKILFDGKNPISNRMIKILDLNNIKYNFWSEIEVDKIKTEDYILILTTNEVESGIRKNLTKLKFTHTYDLYDELITHPNLTKYKNIYRGESCFIIGNGPSLRYEDLDELKKRGIICFASNGIFNIYDKTFWRPDFYTIIDINGLIRFKQGIAALEPEKCFLANSMYIDSKKTERANYFTVKNVLYEGELPEFSDDIANYIVSGKTVTYAMFQIACYMGFSKIFLLGVDWTGGKGTGNPRFDFYDSSKPSVDIGMFDLVNEEKKSYISAENFCKNNEVEVLNLTRGGELEVFPRGDFDRIIQQWK